MRRVSPIMGWITLVVLLLSASLVSAQAGGVSVSCTNGASFENGIEVIVNQMRAGFTYTATAVGVNGFDPVLAVVDGATGDFLCSDDENGASSYAANLPTANAARSSTSAQVNFIHNDSSGFRDISLVVGGFGSQTGEFVLILEGMAVTGADGAGDPFSINLTPGMVASGVPLSVYMLTRGQSGVDPLVFLANAADDLTPAVIDGEQVTCDDAGTLCWNTGSSLDNSSVTIASGTLPGWQYDAMLSLAIDGIALDPNPVNNYLTFVMTSFNQSSEGQYLLAFHIGMTDAVSSSGGGIIGGGDDGKGGIGSTQAQPTAIPTLVPPPIGGGSNAGVPSGVSVSCTNGASFENGIEVIVNQMRAGFTYTATAVGVNGFDPVLAVVDGATGDFLCSDDESGASSYAANLPTANAARSSTSAQVNFIHNDSSGFRDISLVVGGFGNQTGEFVLILEGMAVTGADGAGDPFSINLTPGMVASGVPLSVYMLTRGQSGVDPLVFLANAADDLTPAVIDGEQVTCDDAGTSLCFGTGFALDNYSVTIGSGTLPGWQYDAMLSLAIDGIALDPNPVNNYLTFVMTSFNQSSEGQYLLAFHIGMTDAGGGSNVKNSL